MKFPFLNHRSAERFAELLDQSTDGIRRHDTRGRADAELAELVAVGHRLSAARPAGQVDSEFRVGLRAMLVATAERDGIGRTAVGDGPEPVADLPDGGRRAVIGRRLRTRGAIVLGVAAGALAVSGISAASESASPGDALYTVKRSTERAQLAIAGSNASRGQLSLDFAKNRLAEAVKMDGDASRFTAVLDDMDTDTRKGVRLINGSAVTNKDATRLETLDAFVTEQRSTLEPELGRLSPDNRQRALDSLGLLQDVAGRTENLRTGLACDPPTSAGSDTLGPKLRGCATSSEGRTTPHNGKSTKTGGKDGGEATTPRQTAKPGATTGAGAVPGTTAPAATTSATVASTGTATGTAVTPTPAVTTTGDADIEEDGPLDSLLKDLF
ncbi:DUF5667 domain-containing protein [Actinoplanes sp. NPDC051851]|uniref:DUF5667 domain-containing protein n=1 Tax=Actinoplanes sp. NPDC051851 TaxID=3154753 RepID=UPI003445BA6D